MKSFEVVSNCDLSILILIMNMGIEASSAFIMLYSDSHSTFYSCFDFLKHPLELNLLPVYTS